MSSPWPFWIRDPVPAGVFLGILGSNLEHANEFELPVLTGEHLHAIALAKEATSGWLDGWMAGAAMNLRRFRCLGMLGWPGFFGWWRIPVSGLRVYWMMPKADGDSLSPLWDRDRYVSSPVVYRLWASVRLSHIQAWFHSRARDTIFSAVSSVDCLVRHYFGHWKNLQWCQ